MSRSTRYYSTPGPQKTTVLVLPNVYSPEHAGYFGAIMQYTLKPASRLTLAAAAFALAAAALPPAPASAKTKHTRKSKTHTATHRTSRSPASSARPVAPTPTPGRVLPGVRNSVGDAGGVAAPPSPNPVNSQRGR